MPRGTCTTPSALASIFGGIFQQSTSCDYMKTKARGTTKILNCSLRVSFTKMLFVSSSWSCVASGDLRNLIKTIRSLPDSFSPQMDVTVNDWEFDVVARNAVILLLIFASLNDKTSSQPSFDSTAEALIHVWYSAFIPKSLATSLKSEIGKLLGDSRTHTTEAVHQGMVRKTWTFSRSKILSITLPPDRWPLVAEYLKVPAGLTQQSAKKIREAVMLSPERADYRDRWYYKDASPSMRLAKRKFRRDGLLLPFGHSRTDFDIPNP